LMSDNGNCNCDQALGLQKKLREISRQIDSFEEKVTFYHRRAQGIGEQIFFRNTDEWLPLLNYIRRLCREETDNERT
jgi:hypothetical protein